MKLVIALIAAMAVPAQSQAGGSDDVCVLIGNMSEVIMRNRQDKVPISTALGVIAKSGMTGALADAVKGLIIEAYKQPGYSTSRVQDRSVKDFRIEAELACYSGI